MGASILLLTVVWSIGLFWTGDNLEKGRLRHPSSRAWRAGCRPSDKRQRGERGTRSLTVFSLHFLSSSHSARVCLLSQLLLFLLSFQSFTHSFIHSILLLSFAFALLACLLTGCLACLAGLVSRFVCVASVSVGAGGGRWSIRARCSTSCRRSAPAWPPSLAPRAACGSRAPLGGSTPAR